MTTVAVPADEVQGDGSAPGGIVRHHGAARAPDHLRRQGLVLPGIDFLDPRRHHAHGGKAAFQRGPVGDGIGPEGEPADDEGRSGGFAHREDDPPAPLPAVGAQVPGADDGDGGTEAENLRRGRGGVEIEPQRRVGAFGEQFRIVIVPAGDEAEALFPDLLKLFVGPFQFAGRELFRKRPVGPEGLPERVRILAEHGRGGAEMLHEQMPGDGLVTQHPVQGAEGGSFVVVLHLFLRQDRAGKRKTTQTVSDLCCFSMLFNDSVRFYRISRASP